MIAPKTPSPTPCADAEDRSDMVSLTPSNGAKPAALPDFAVICAPNRRRLPIYGAALVARLAEIGRAL
jgi:hypothetical protein